VYKDQGLATGSFNGLHAGLHAKSEFLALLVHPTPFFPFPDRPSSVFSAVSEKQIPNSTVKSLPMQFPFVTLTLIWFILATCVCSAAEKTGDLNIQVDFATGIGISPPTRAVL
jgi:hypothetical protein